MSSAVCIYFEQQIEITAKENRLRKCLIFIIIVSMHQLMEADGVRVSVWGEPVRDSVPPTEIDTIE